jgi:hypothetical protein
MNIDGGVGQPDSYRLSAWSSDPQVTVEVGDETYRRPQRLLQALSVNAFGQCWSRLVQPWPRNEAPWPDVGDGAWAASPMTIENRAGVADLLSGHGRRSPIADELGGTLSCCEHAKGRFRATLFFDAPHQ